MARRRLTKETPIKDPFTEERLDDNRDQEVNRKSELYGEIIESSDTIDDKTYEFKDRFVPWQEGDSPLSIRSTADFFRYLKYAKKEKHNVEVDARVLGYSKSHRQTKIVKLNAEQMLEAFDKNKNRKFKFRQAGFDNFSNDWGDSGQVGGADYVPFLGGPFTKQLYYWDYLKMHQAAFFASNHDPAASAIVGMTSDFTLGRGFKPVIKDEMALGLWNAFAEANNLDEQMEYLARETTIYGEVMLYWLPHNQTKIAYQLPKDKIPVGILPRVRLIDPSTIWEIVTYPEDITRVLYYQQIFPTQYQTYTDGQPSSKFIFQQIPAELVDHFKLNVVSNEKRGRTDLFSILGYLKRLRDSINYGIIAQQKNAAWAIDTEVDGDGEAIKRYVASQKAIGTVPPPGSEHVHSKKIKRTYQSNTGHASGGASSIFEWVLSMIAMGSRFPISYFGTHLSGGQTRASAIVSTEPIAKKLEKRQLLYRRILLKMAKRLFEKFDMHGVEVDFSFPEIITQDRTARFKDMALAEAQQWIPKAMNAPIAAKELGIENFKYRPPETPETSVVNPLTGGLLKVKPGVGPVDPDVGSTDNSGAASSTSALTSKDKKAVNDARG